MLNNYKVEMWNGGKVHKIRNNIIHLMRGQVQIKNIVLKTNLGGKKKFHQSKNLKKR